VQGGKRRGSVIDSTGTAKYRFLVAGSLLMASVATAPVASGGGQNPIPKCFGKEATILGTDDPESLIGTPGPDVIVGLKGTDFIRGLKGKDLICAGPGGQSFPNEEYAIGNAGRDKIRGGSGHDLVIGNAGVDHIFGGRGFERFLGGRGDDELYGGNKLNGDSFIGGPGDDYIEAKHPGSAFLFLEPEPPVRVDLAAGFAIGEGRDTLVNIAHVDGAHTYRNVIIGNGLNNRLFGGSKQDEIRGAGGKDTLVGYDGDDKLIGGDGKDLADGFGGFDICEAEELHRCEG
jgi:Ca2+-binding RTX toxin-like protein